MHDFAGSIFRTRAAGIRKHVPQFDTERVIGSSFDTLHQGAAHRSDGPAGLANAQTEELKLGQATLRLISTPVIDGQGNRVGTVVQWIDRTEEIAVEEELEM